MMLSNLSYYFKYDLEPSNFAFQTQTQLSFSDLVWFYFLDFQNKSRDELNYGQDVKSVNMTTSHNHEFNYQSVVKEFNEGSRISLLNSHYLLPHNLWLYNEVSFTPEKYNQIKSSALFEILNNNLDKIKKSEKDQFDEDFNNEENREDENSKELTEHGNGLKSFIFSRLRSSIEEVSNEATGKECANSKSDYTCLESKVLDEKLLSTNSISKSFQHKNLKCDSLSVQTSSSLYFIKLIMGIRSVIRLLLKLIPNGLSIHLSLSLILLFLINGMSSQLQLSDENGNYPSLSDIIDEDVLEILRAESITRLEHDDAGQCIFVKSEGGTYSYISPGGNTEVCGLYVISEPDQVVGFEFEYFDISCSKGGLVSVIDGWELNGQFFPGSKDHLIPKSQRYNEFCGSTKPRKPFKASQNVGLIEFRIPIKGEGFKVKVKFHSNPKPCNAILQNPQGVFTLRNYGRKLNCSVSIMFPESFRILSTNIGIQERPGKILHSNLYFETGIVRKCKKRGLNDYVEIIGGDGLDTDVMKVAEEFCGLDSIPSAKKVDIACGNTAIRMVSSGKYDNSVTIAFDLISHFASSTLICPTFTDSQ